jgi:hypothetical protein
MYTRKCMHTYIHHMHAYDIILYGYIQIIIYTFAVVLCVFAGICMHFDVATCNIVHCTCLGGPQITLGAYSTGVRATVFLVLKSRP